MGLLQDIRLQVASPPPNRVSTKIDVELERFSLHKSLKELTIVTVKDWKRLACDDLHVSHLTGGATNMLFKVTHARSTPGQSVVRAVVVRVFGEETDQFIDRSDWKSDLMHVLSKLGFGAKVLSSFLNGLVEEFIEGETVTTKELISDRSLLVRVARKIKCLHDYSLMESLPCGSRARYHMSEPSENIWKTLQLRYDLACTVMKDRSIISRADVREAFSIMNVNSDTHRKLLQSVRARCDSVKSPIVFCHNDIHAGNFIINRQTGALTLIDYEYSDYGPRAFDIANFFCEFAGFECNYSLYPTASIRRKFYSAYLGTGEKGTDLSALELEVASWTPVVHAYWAFWAIIQLKCSTIDVDFFSYALARMKQFFDLAQYDSNQLLAEEAVSAIAS